MEIIGGHRLVRRLGGGRRAEVFLAHSIRPDDSGRPRVAAIKRFRPETGLESIDTEIEALARISSPHLLRLEDLATAGDGRPALLVERLGPTSLADLLLERSAIDPGEFVTLVAPIAAAVETLHSRGVAHGGLRVGSIRFDDRGAPVLCGFGSATIIGPLPGDTGESSLTPAEAERSPALLRDLADLIAVVQTVAAVIEPSAVRDSFLDALAHIEVSRRPETVAAEIVDRVFAFAVPSSIDFARSRDASTVSTATTVTTGAARSRAEAAPIRRAEASSDDHRIHASSRLLGLTLPEPLDRVISELSERTTPVVRRVREILRTVRMPIWIAAGTSVMLVIAAIAVIPQGSTATAESSTAESSIVTAEGSTAVGPDDQARSPVPVIPTPQQAAIVQADDPVPAAQALLEVRARCLGAQSITCLDSVVQAGSAIAEADAWAVRQAQESASAPRIDTFDAPELIERIGDSALLSTSFSVTEQASPEAAHTAAAQSDAAQSEAASPESVGTDQAAVITIVLMRVAGEWRLRDLMTG